MGGILEVARERRKMREGKNVYRIRRRMKK